MVRGTWIIPSPVEVVNRTMPAWLRNWCQPGSPGRGEEESVWRAMVTGVHGKELSTWTFLMVQIVLSELFQTRTGAKACVTQKRERLGNGSDLAGIGQNVLRT